MKDCEPTAAFSFPPPRNGPPHKPVERDPDCAKKREPELVLAGGQAERGKEGETKTEEQKRRRRARREREKRERKMVE